MTPPTSLSLHTHCCSASISLHEFPFWEERLTDHYLFLIPHVRFKIKQNPQLKPGKMTAMDTVNGHESMNLHVCVIETMVSSPVHVLCLRVHSSKPGKEPLCLWWLLGGHCWNRVEARRWCRAAHVSASNGSWTSSGRIPTEGLIITLC